MLKKGEAIISEVRKGTTKISQVYLGDRKIFPGLVSTTSGVEYSGWSYNLPYRSRSFTPYTQYNYQDGSYSKVYGTTQSESQIATITWEDPGVWYYYASNSYREKSIFPVYTFPDGVFFEGDSEVVREYGTDSSIWQYNDPVRTKQIVYQYTDTQKQGPLLQETAETTYEYSAWSYNYLPNYRYRIVTPMYTYSQYSPFELRDGDTFNEYDYVSNSSTYWQYDYPAGKRTGVTTYTFASGATHQVSGVVQYYITKQTVDSLEYDNGVCDPVTFEYVDYKQVYDNYYWQSQPSPTTPGLYDGAERRERIVGMCGWVKGWSLWENTGQLCNASGNLGYSCDGEWTVYYNRQARHYQFPDGSGRTATEYRAGTEHSRMKVHGQCGFIDPSSRIEVPFSGYDMYSQQAAYFSHIHGSLWLDNNNGQYYTSYDGDILASEGIYLIADLGDWEFSDYIVVQNF